MNNCSQYKAYGSLLTTDCTQGHPHLWQRQSREMVSPQTLKFRGSFLLFFLFFLLHSQGNRLSYALRKCSWDTWDCL
jgi:hypothetical protein